MSLLIELLKQMHFLQYVYSKPFQQLKFQLLHHDADFFLIYFCDISKNCEINYLQFSMLYSMIHKCLMTPGQQFSIFWQQARHFEIYIVPIISTSNQGR